MKKFTLFIVVILIGLHTNGQDLKQLMKTGDSLINQKIYDKAATVYKNLVSNILNGKIKVNDDQWRIILFNAGMSGHKSGELETIVKYNNMYYGSKGEKLSEKVDFLNAFGAKFIYSYCSYVRGGTKSIVIDGCSINEKKYVVWYGSDNWYVQAFDECETYKPIAFQNSRLYELFSSSLNQLLKENITDLKMYNSHSLRYEFEFYSKSDKVIKDFDDADITAFKPGSRELTTLKERNVFDAYERNLKSKMTLLQKLSQSLIVKYKDTLSSIPERQKIGQL